MLQEMVGPFHSEFYVISGMLLESRKRREHLSEEDLQKNKAIMESFTKGNTQGFDNNGEVQIYLLLLVYYTWFGCSVLTCVVAYMYIAVS
jgi:hypothetical protein